MRRCDKSNHRCNWRQCSGVNSACYMNMVKTAWTCRTRQPRADHSLLTIVRISGLPDRAQYSLDRTSDRSAPACHKADRKSTTSINWARHPLACMAYLNENRQPSQSFSRQCEKKSEGVDTASVFVHLISQVYFKMACQWNSHRRTCSSRSARQRAEQDLIRFDMR